jgi:hypothetical protein
MAEKAGWASGLKVLKQIFQKNLSRLQTMNISSFDDLLQAARLQPEPQRLLFVFTAAELPEHSAEAEKEKFAAREGGALSPVICVDKSPDHLADFSGLLRESAETGQDWDIVFVSSMSGRAGIAPNSDEAEHPLLLMVEAVKSGNIGSLLAFNKDGEIVQVSRG